MTHKQYLEIKTWVLSELDRIGAFEIPSKHFIEHFDLSRPYYEQLMRLVLEDGHPFDTQAEWLDASGDPAQVILFQLPGK